MDEYGRAYAPQNPAAGFMDPVFRDNMDAQRSSWRRTPEAEYPSGYLGTINTRRSDRLIKAIGKQMNRKVYDRGVHKGERIDRSDYFWPAEWTPMRGLEHQAMGIKQAPFGLPAQRLVNDGKPSPQDQVVLMDPHRVSQLGNMRPRWR
jgi:hypothetical protein